MAKPVIIKPTVGRVVLYYPKRSEGMGGGPLAAIVSAVHSDTVVSLVVFCPHGTTNSRKGVRLVQEGGDPATANEPHCEWMQYQKGQAAKTEQVSGDYEKRLNMANDNVQRLRDEVSNLKGAVADLGKRLCQHEAKPKDVSSTASKEQHSPSDTTSTTKGSCRPG